MRAGAFALVLALPLGSVSMGCEGESSFAIPLFDAGTPDARYEAACGSWAQALCANEAACLTVAPWTDGAQCVARETIRCELLASDPSVAFDPTKVAQCPEPDAGDCAAPPGDFCLPSGLSPFGAPCLWSEACQSGYCAYGFDPATGFPNACGSCQPLPCNGACPGGQQCTFDSDGGTACVPIAGPGDPCSGPGDACGPLYYCGPGGKCAPQARLGEPCGDGTNTGPPCADFNQYCDGTRHCRTYLSSPYQGSCGIVGNQAYLCAGSGTCDPTGGQCLPPASDGEICDDSQGLPCLPPARCISSECVFPSLAICGSTPGP